MSTPTTETPDITEPPAEQTTTSRQLRRNRKREAREAWRQTGVGWRVLPRTLLGICVALVVFAIGVGVSGAALFVYYDSRLSDNEAIVVNASTDLERETAAAVSSLDAASTTGAERLTRTMGPYALFLQDADGLPTPSAAVNASLLRVTTTDLSGIPVAGSAVSVGSSPAGTLLITSFSLVAAQEATPSPQLTVQRDNASYPATLWKWDKDLDLAVLVVDADIPAATFGRVDDLALSVGSPVFAVSAFDATSTPGVTATVSDAGLRHTAPLGSDFQGGPVVNAQGAIVAFTSNYQPGNYNSGSVPWAATIVQLCRDLVRCDNDTVTDR